VQDNHSKSAKGVLRGLHYQIQHPQGKLVRVVQGEVFEGRLGTGHDAGDIRVFSGRPWFLVCSLATSLVALCVLVALTVLAVLFLLAFGWGCRHR
jgi:hypothetical protein